jgi:hypothetical protein
MTIRFFKYAWNLPWMFRVSLSKWGFAITSWFGWIGLSVLINHHEKTTIHSTTIEGKLIEKYDETKVTTGLYFLYSPNREWLPGAVSYFRWLAAGKLATRDEKWGESQRWLWGEV